MDEEDRASVCRGWRFVQYFKDRYLPDFLLGWDVGRAAMLARWGCYLGWSPRGRPWASCGSCPKRRPGGCTAGGNSRNRTCSAA